MRYLIIFILLPFFGGAQNFLERIEVTQEGEKSYFLLTQNGYDDLLAGIPADLGELASQLLTMQSEISNQRSESLKLMEKIAELEKMIEELSDNDDDDDQGKVALSQWDLMANDVRSLSKSQFNRKYTEKNIVDIAITYPMAPEELKTTKGKKSEKIDLLYKFIIQ